MISPASFPTDLPTITQLFRAYAQSLPIDLGYRGFDGELASLPGKYAPAPNANPLPPLGGRGQGEGGAPADAE